MLWRKGALPYWVMTLEKARINAYDVETAIDVDGAPILREVITFAYRTVSIDYTLQGGTGAGMSASNFTGDTGPDV